MLPIKRLVTPRRLALVATAALLTATPFSLGVMAWGAPGPQASLDQYADLSSAWINGNLGAHNSTYTDTQTVPFRALVTNLSTGTHTLAIQWDTMKNGNPAYEQQLNAFDDTVSPDPTAAPLPAGFTAGAKVSGNPVTIFGGSGVSVAYTGAGTPTNSATITFTAGGSDVILAWGGKLAVGASAVNGSPYHMALVSLDGKNIGGQDRSIKVSPAAPVRGPALTLDKAASPTTYSAVGNTITYTYTLLNSGTVTLQDPYAITDDVVGAVACTFTGNLGVGDETTCTATYQITSANMGVASVTNHATATARHGNDTVTSNQAQATITNTYTPPPPPPPPPPGPVVVPTVTANPVLSAAKTASPTLYDRAGQVITYTFTLTNTGNVTLSGPFSVSDSKLGTVPCGTTSTLAAGASVSCSANYTVTAADMAAGSVTNSARGSGSYSGSPVVSGPVTATVAEIHPAIGVTKSVNPTSVVLPGGTVTFTYTVTNSGDTVLSPVTVTDDVLGAIGNAASLQPGESATFTRPATITGSSPTTNTATATGTDPLGTQVTAQAKASVTVVAGEQITAPTTTPAPPKTAPSLPFTGQPTGVEAAGGAALVSLGWVLLRIGRRARRR